MLSSNCEETVIKEYAHLSTVLTNHKIIYTGKSGQKIIFLNELKTCKMRKGRNTFLGAIAIMMFLVMETYLFLGKMNLVPYLLIITVGFAIAYFLSRKNVLTMASPNEKIIIDVHKVKKSKVRYFIHAVKKARKDLQKEIIA